MTDLEDSGQENEATEIKSFPPPFVSDFYSRESAMQFVVGFARNNVMDANMAIQEARKIEKWLREGDPKPEDDSDNSD